MWSWVDCIRISWVKGKFGDIYFKSFVLTWNICVLISVWSCANSISYNLYDSIFWHPIWGWAQFPSLLFWRWESWGWYPMLCLRCPANWVCYKSGSGSKWPSLGISILEAAVEFLVDLSKKTHLLSSRQVEGEMQTLDPCWATKQDKIVKLQDSHVHLAHSFQIAFCER